jgi:hypothetical protein
MRKVTGAVCRLQAEFFFFECDPEQQSLRRALLQTQH